MIYSFITEGFDQERREQFDRTLENTGPAGSEKAKARRERETIDRLLKLPGG